MPTINDSVQFLKGVGPAFAKKFEKLGILTIRDLLLCYPRKYIDYTQPYTVVSAPAASCCTRWCAPRPRSLTARLWRSIPAPTVCPPAATPAVPMQRWRSRTSLWTRCRPSC